MSDKAAAVSAEPGAAFLVILQPSGTVIVLVVTVLTALKLDESAALDESAVSERLPKPNRCPRPDESRPKMLSVI